MAACLEQRRGVGLRVTFVASDLEDDRVPGSIVALEIEESSGVACIDEPPLEPFPARTPADPMERSRSELPARRTVSRQLSVKGRTAGANEEVSILGDQPRPVGRLVLAHVLQEQLAVLAKKVSALSPTREPEGVRPFTQGSIHAREAEATIGRRIVAEELRERRALRARGRRPAERSYGLGHLGRSPRVYLLSRNTQSPSDAGPVTAFPLGNAFAHRLLGSEVWNLPEVEGTPAADDRAENQEPDYASEQPTSHYARDRRTLLARRPPSEGGSRG
jgi:hypothetical protein